MRRVLAAALALAAIAPPLDGCAGGQPVPAGAYQAPYSYAPYDEQTNPFCGATATCAPRNALPYAMHGNVD